MNYLSSGSSVIGDSVSALGAMIAFYYGLTGFACVWYYRKSLTESARSLWLRGILPLLGGLILWFAMFWFLWYNWITPEQQLHDVDLPGNAPCHRRGVRHRSSAPSSWASCCM